MSEPTGYADDTARSRRLATLRVLRENEGAANESLLRTCLHQLGFRGRFVTAEALTGDQAMLSAAGFVTVEYYMGRVRTLVITPRGLLFLKRQIDPIPGIDYPDVA